MGTQGNCFSSKGSDAKQENEEDENAQKTTAVTAAQGMTPISSNEPARRKRKKPGKKAYKVRTWIIKIKF